MGVSRVITVICPTLNEQRNIANFCQGYDFADKIIIGDGGSTDKTREIANQYQNVEILDCSHTQISTPSDPSWAFRNNASVQINFLIDRAKALESRWIIKDDCDSWPNPRLKAEAKLIFAMAGQGAVFAYHLYILGQDKYFPKMNEPGPGLWAWQPSRINIYGDEKNTRSSALFGVPSDGFKVKLPLALLHYFAPDEKTIQRKIVNKAAKGIGMEHPLTWQYAPAEELPEWALAE